MAGKPPRRPRSGSHLRLRNGIYYYRRVVPAELVGAFGCVEVSETLDTSNLADAERLEKPRDVEFERRLREARRARDPEGLAEQIATQTGLRITLSNKWGGVPDEPHLTDTDRLIAMSLANQHIMPRYRLISELDGLLAGLTGDQIERASGALLSVVRHQIARIGGDAPPPPSNDVHTLEWAYSRWLRIGSGVRTNGSVELARRHYDSFIAHSKLVMLDQVRRSHLIEWRDGLVDTGDYRPNSINQRLQLVGAILRAGWRDAEMAEQNLKGVILPNPDDNDRGAWHRDEILKVLLALQPRSWSAWVYLIGLTTGVRLGEPMAARVDWFNPVVGIIDVNDRRATKTKKLHCMPLLPFLREPLARYVGNRVGDDYLFADAPRSANPKLRAGHEASKWFGRFFTKHHVDRVFHELRDTWIEAARHSKVERGLWEIISGHSAETVSDRYGGKKPDVLVSANQEICQSLTADKEIRNAIIRLVE